ncbi:metallophosphoesterase family protein [Paratissierella segnis]|uniref:metallophosphoesterase family protein n=1 Tax=Paratissierella segnis TaxID=2763679 RepID=UPI00223BE171|nr:DNA repair exonuclease [Paratissierella segnis]
MHTGDIHLGLKFNKVSFHKDKAVMRRRELWSTFERIVNYCTEKSVDFLLIAGDLFEYDYFTIGDIKRVRDIFMKAKGINILIVAGNHDILNNKSLYNRVEWSPNVTIFQNKLEKKVFSDLNTVIYGYSWDRSEIADNHLFDNFEYEHEDNDKNKMLILHGDINKESKYLPLTLDELNKLNMDYIALGHIHKPIIYNDKIAYCGSPEPLDFGELGERGIIQGVIENGKTKFEFLPFSMRCFYEEDIDIDGNMGYLDIKEKVKSIQTGNPEKDFYRIYLKGYAQNDISLENLYEDIEEYFYHVELFDETIPDYDLDALEVLHKDNIVGQFIRNMKGKDLNKRCVKEALYIGLEVLLKEVY